MKRIVLILSLLGLSVFMVTGCSFGGSSDENADFDLSKEITVISREANSGTRAAFDEIMGIVEKEGDSVQDKLYSEAVIVDSTDSVASKVEVDKFAIGYTSLGSVNDTIKSVAVDGVSASVENVRNGSYTISRPFILGTLDSVSDVAKDFLDFISSSQGQDIVESRGYISALDGAGEYSAKNISGKITLSGSTSVEKVIEKLREEYIKLNPNVEIEITYSGSSAGIKDVLEGKVDIGMSSRELKEDEKASIDGIKFALDGIAVVINASNPVLVLSSEDITSIFRGEFRNWSDVVR